MGRSSGFIAMHASLASGQIDICLIPEVVMLNFFMKTLFCETVLILLIHAHKGTFPFTRSPRSFAAS